MNTLELIDQAFEVSPLLREHGERAATFPLFDLRQGHAGTDVCLRVAAKTRANAQDIALELLSEANYTLPLTLNAEGGFIQCRYPPKISWLRGREVLNNEPAIRTASICVFAGSSLSSAQRLRLSCLGWFHSLLARFSDINVSLYLGGDRTAPPLVALESCYRPFALPGEIADSDLVFVWCDRAFGHTEAFREWARRIKLRSPLLVKSPDPAWLEGLPNEFDLERGDVEAALQLAGPEPGDEIDLSALHAQRWSNFLWWIEDTKRRGDSVGPCKAVNACADSTTPIESGMLDLLVRLKFFPAYVSLAARRGELWAFQTTCRAVLRAANAFMNDPEVRERVDRAQLLPHEVEILAGVGSAVSDMVELFKHGPTNWA